MSAISHQSRNSINYRNVFSLFQTIICRAEASVLGIEKVLLFSNLGLQKLENTELNIDN